MAGLSSRFKNAGYLKPKYMLPLWERTVFEWSILSFKNYFLTQKFIFVIPNSSEVYNFVDSCLKKIKIDFFEIISISNTEGQADTAYQALTKLKIIDVEDLLIFNIDTFRPDFIFPKTTMQYSGYLEVFCGEGENWSFILPDPTNSHLVKLTSEKKRISEYCSTGMYYFRRISIFKEAYEHYLKYNLESLEGKERYIAPIYNYLIACNHKISYNVIQKNEVIFCGVPEEYLSLINNTDIKNYYK